MSPARGLHRTAGSKSTNSPRRGLSTTLLSPIRAPSRRYPRYQGKKSPSVATKESVKSRLGPKLSVKSRLGPRKIDHRPKVAILSSTRVAETEGCDIFSFDRSDFTTLDQIGFTDCHTKIDHGEVDLDKVVIKKISAKDT